MWLLWRQVKRENTSFPVAVWFSRRQGGPRDEVENPHKILKYSSIVPRIVLASSVTKLEVYMYEHWLQVNSSTGINSPVLLVESLCSVVLEVDLEPFGQWRRALFSLLIGYDPKAIPIVQVRPAMNLFCQPSQSKTKLPSRDSVLWISLSHALTRLGQFCSKLVVLILVCQWLI